LSYRPVLGRTALLPEGVTPTKALDPVGASDRYGTTV